MSGRDLWRLSCPKSHSKWDQANTSSGQPQLCIVAVNTRDENSTATLGNMCTALEHLVTFIIFTLNIQPTKAPPVVSAPC